MAQIQVRRNNELSTSPGTQTVGMSRAETFLSEDTCAVRIRTQPGAISGWHHHGNHTTYGYVISGKLRFEFGPGGSEVIEAEPGDFFMVPSNTVHRETNPASDEQVLVGFRIGTGPTVLNVDGPDDS